MLHYSALFIILLIRQISSDEKHCSKFHYEEKLLEKMIRMEIRLETFQERLDQLEHQNTVTSTDTVPAQSGERTIAFFATATTQRRSYQSNEILIFDTVITNQGGAYDADTGVFTTPYGGIYVFFSTVLTNNDKELWNYFSVNEVKIANFNAHGTGGRHDSGSATILVQLNKGDKVSVKNSHAPGETYGENYTHLGGFCLSY